MRQRVRIGVAAATVLIAAITWQQRGKRSADAQGGITTEQDKRLLPGPPGKITASAENGAVAVRWQGTRLEIVTSYRVYRRRAPASWSHLADVRVLPDNAGEHEFRDERGCAACEYAVSAVDVWGNEGPRQPVSVTGAEPRSWRNRAGRSTAHASPSTARRGLARFAISRRTGLHSNVLSTAGGRPEGRGEGGRE
jgi:hypothetical protein